MHYSGLTALDGKVIVFLFSRAQLLSSFSRAAKFLGPEVNSCCCLRTRGIVSVVRCIIFSKDVKAIVGKLLHGASSTQQKQKVVRDSGTSRNLKVCFRQRLKKASV